MRELNDLLLNSEKQLKPEELITLKGGFEVGGTCGYHCWANYNSSYQASECGLSQSQVQGMISTYQSYDWSCNWCCDSCGSSSYCGN
jgi:hypothetical protein